jgi:DNA repair protein RadC
MKNHNTDTLIAESRIPEIILSYKSKIPFSVKPKITSSRTCYEILLSLWNANTIEIQEEFKILLLNRANAVLGISDISSGGITGTVVDIRLILATALKSGATGIILSHNHPSGNLVPSKSDQSLTDKIRTAAEYMDIRVLDHIILTNEGYYSFADEGFL